MNLITFAQGEPWMTPSELNLNREFIRATAEYLAAAGVTETALVALRVNDVASTWLLARRLESGLAPREGEAPPCPTPAQAGAIGKCRERLRKAIKELEACCPRTGAPKTLGLIERMHQVHSWFKQLASGHVARGGADFAATVLRAPTGTFPMGAGNPLYLRPMSGAA